MILKWECKIDGLNGYITYESLHFVERIKIAAVLKLKFDENGKIEFGELDQNEMFVKMYEIIKKQVKEVSINTGETTITNFHDLGYYAEFNLIIADLIALIMKEEKLGKQQSRP